VKHKYTHVSTQERQIDFRQFIVWDKYCRQIFCAIVISPHFLRHQNGTEMKGEFSESEISLSNFTSAYMYNRSECEF